jgi:hypothetical protein
MPPIIEPPNSGAVKASNNVSRTNRVQTGDVDGMGVVAASLHEGENAGAEPSHPNAEAKETAISAGTLLHVLDIASDIDSTDASTYKRQSRPSGMSHRSSRNQAPAQATVTSPALSEQLHEDEPNPPTKVQPKDGELAGGHTQAQVGFLAQAADKVIQERDIPAPGTPPAKV